MSCLSRRAFFKIAGVAVAAGVLDTFPWREVRAHEALPERARTRLRSTPRTSPRHPPDTAAPASGYVFFDPDDAAFVEAAVERLIPADEDGPGAFEAGVSIFIDRQLAGAWGAGRRLDRNGPWQPHAPRKAERLPATPAELFRNALRGIEIDLQRRPETLVDKLVVRRRETRMGSPSASLALQSSTVASTVASTTPPDSPTSPTPISARRGFARLSAGAQDRYLKSLQAGEKDLAGIPSQVFFECLLGLTIEGFFSDPAHSGDEDSVA